MPELIEAHSHNLDRHLTRVIQQPNLSRDGISFPFLQLGVTPQMRARTTIDAELVNVGRNIDTLFAGFYRLGSYTSPDSLQQASRSAGWNR